MTYRAVRAGDHGFDLISGNALALLNLFPASFEVSVERCACTTIFALRVDEFQGMGDYGGGIAEGTAGDLLLDEFFRVSVQGENHDGIIANARKGLEVSPLELSGAKFFAGEAFSASYGCGGLVDGAVQFGTVLRGPWLFRAEDVLGVVDEVGRAGVVAEFDLVLNALFGLGGELERLSGSAEDRRAEKGAARSSALEGFWKWRGGGRWRWGWYGFRASSGEWPEWESMPQGLKPPKFAKD